MGGGHGWDTVTALMSDHYHGPELGHREGTASRHERESQNQESTNSEREEVVFASINKQNLCSAPSEGSRRVGRAEEGR